MLSLLIIVLCMLGPATLVVFTHHHNPWWLMLYLLTIPGIITGYIKIPDILDWWEDKREKINLKSKQK
jgi:hypothetical protein